MTDAMAGEVRRLRAGHSRMLGPPMLWVVVWLVTGLVLNASQVWLFQALWIMAAPIFLLHAGWGIGLAGIYLWRVVKRSGRDFAPALWTMLVLLPGLALLSVSPVLRDIGDRAVFMVRKAEYDHFVAEVAAGRFPEPLSWAQDNRIGGYSFRPDNRDLIVFRWFNGVPDGGYAIVYDATDSVMNGEREGWEAASPGFADLLAGRPVSCERYADPHYFMCDFT